MFEIYKIALIVICVTGTGLLPIGIHIHTYARYNYGGIWIIAYGTICGAVSFAMLLDLVFKGLNA